MKLYFGPGACSLAPHILLQETGLPHTLMRVDTRKHQTQDVTGFHTIDPKGYVPVRQLGQRLAVQAAPAAQA